MDALFWFLDEKNNPSGPVTKDAIIERIRQGKTGPLDLIFTSGLSEWESAGASLHFRPFFLLAGRPATPPPLPIKAASNPIKPPPPPRANQVTPVKMRSFLGAILHYFSSRVLYTSLVFIAALFFLLFKGHFYENSSVVFAGSTPIVTTLSKESISNLLETGLSQQNEASICEDDYLISRVFYRNKTMHYDNYGHVLVMQDNYPLFYQSEYQWDNNTKYVLGILAHAGFIEIYKGGLNPSGLYKIASFSDYKMAFSEIEAHVDPYNGLYKKEDVHAALVNITDEGIKAHIHKDSGYGTPGFCVRGQWRVKDILNWTDPGPDNSGKTVTLVKAQLKFVPNAVGDAILKDDFSVSLEKPLDIVLVKYNDGWKIDDN